MAGTTQSNVYEDQTLVDQDGEKIGTVEDVYTDDASGQPTWALVHSGLFGHKKTFVPLRGAQSDGDEVRVPITKAQVKDAPHVDPDEQLGAAEEETLFAHYGVKHQDDSLPPEATTGRDVSGPETDDAMTRSEEELRVGTERVESGRVRLRKYVVTEQVTQTVPVQHEEVRLEREPITDANVGAATDGPAISEEEHEVVLHEDRPVVEKAVVPKERVRLETDTVTGEERVTDEVRQERIDTDGADDGR
jgi:uncharacterized protein (TIGR02271 family)